MRHDIRKLHGNEVGIFRKMIQKYYDYDKIDLLVHKTLKIVGVPKEEFQNRKVKEGEKEIEVIIHEADELNKFCDGDSCELDPIKLGKC